MTPALDQLHDATLVTIRFDWATRTCNFDFAGSPQLIESFTVTFTDVIELVIPANWPWGRSVSVLEARDNGSGRHEFEMQTGDIIVVVVGPNNSFKPTPHRGAGHVPTLR